MNKMQPVGRPAKPTGVSIWTYLTVALVLAGIGLGALSYALYHANSDKIRLAGELAKQQNENQRRELDAQKSAANDKLALAQNQQAQLLAQISPATNSLLRLLDGSAALRSEAAALRTNEAGRAVALHSNLVALARRCFESSLPEIPPEPDVITRLEAVRRIEQQVLAARGTAYEPAAAFGVTVQNATTWAEQGLLKLGQARDALSGVVQESKIKFTRAILTPDSPTLGAAITKQDEDLAGSQLRQAEQTVSAARTNAVLTRAEADALAEKTRADADAQKVRAEADRYAEESRRKLAEEQAAKEQEWQRREANLKLLAATNQVVVQTKAQEARNVELRKKATEPAVLTALGPFITPGYVQIKSMGTELKPLSYSALDGTGALTTNIHGLTRLLTIAWTSVDKVRPRWKINPTLFTRHPAELEKVKEAQSLLIELGPVLVEMGKLQP